MIASSRAGRCPGSRFCRAYIHSIARRDRTDRQLAGAAPPAQPDVTEQIENLGALREQGALTEAEFAAKKTELLGRICSTNRDEPTRPSTAPPSAGDVAQRRAQSRVEPASCHHS